VCINCYDPYDELCIECSRKEGEREVYPMLHERRGIKTEADLGIKLFMYGFILSFIGAMLMTLSSLIEGSGSGGFIIFVWPLPPIVSAWGPHGPLILFILTVATLLVFVYFVLRYLFPGKKS